MKTFEFSLVLRTRENTEVFITLDDNIYGIHNQSKYPVFYVCRKSMVMSLVVELFRVNIDEYFRSFSTLVMLNILRCHTYAYFTAVKVVLGCCIEVHILNDKQCCRSQHIWIFIV